MTTKIRRSVFETNSSSTHSISIASGAETLDKLLVGPDGVCRIYGGEFGWEVEDYFDAATKASYAMVWALEMNSETYCDMLKKVVKEATGAKEVILVEGEDDSFYPHGYIDHQSSDVCAEAFASEEKLRDFIFNPKSRLHTCNDNGGCPRCEEEWEKKYGNN